MTEVLLTNYNLFRQCHIVSPWEERLAVEKRKGTAFASPVGRQIQKLIGTDARNADHLIEGYLGGYGRIVTALGDDLDYVLVVYQASLNQTRYGMLVM